MTERERAQDAELLPCPFCGSTPILHQATPESPAHRPVECSNHTCCMSYMWPDREVWQARRPDARDETIRRLHKTIMRMCADEVRLDWLIENAATTGGGHGVTLTVFIPHDSEDVRGAIDGARAALKDAP